MSVAFETGRELDSPRHLRKNWIAEEMPWLKPARPRDAESGAGSSSSPSFSSSPAGKPPTRKSKTLAGISKKTTHWVIKQGSTPSAARTPFAPVGKLLTCEPDALPEMGMAVVRWLSEKINVQTLALDWLFSRIDHDRIFEGPIGDHNRIAAIEILARYNHPSASRLVDRYLSKPVHEFHLYLLPLARLPQFAGGREAGSIAQKIVRLYRESKECQSPEQWRGRFTVETFRSLEVLSPRDALELLTSDLGSIGGLELTPVLEAACLAARKLDRDELAHGPLKAALLAALLTVWDRYTMNRSAENIGNRPGIMGQLLELLGRVGVNLTPLLAGLEGHPLRMQALYQFARRPLDFTSASTQLRWHAEILRLMIDAQQYFTLKKFLVEIVVPAMTPELHKTVIEKLMDIQIEQSASQ